MNIHYSVRFVFVKGNVYHKDNIVRKNWIGFKQTYNNRLSLAGLNLKSYVDKILGYFDKNKPHTIGKYSYFNQHFGSFYESLPSF